MCQGRLDIQHPLHIWIGTILNLYPVYLPLCRSGIFVLIFAGIQHFQ